TLGLHLVEREAADPAGLVEVFGALDPGEVEGVLVISPALQVKFTSLILRLAAERRVPLATHRREWVAQGALFSYSPDFRNTGQAAARHVDKILRGARPADIPVESRDIIELVINLKTAQALGLTIPPHVLLQATEVIQ